MAGLRMIALGLLCCLAAGAGAQSVFDLPRLFPQHRRILGQFMDAAKRGDLTAAEAAARAGAKLFPRDANWHYNVACVCARAGRPDEALEWLGLAIDRGFTQRSQIEADADLATLRSNPKYAELLAKADALAANPPQNPTLSAALAEPVVAGQEAVVSSQNTQWNWDPSMGGYSTTLLQILPGREAKPYDGVLYVNRDEDLCVVNYEDFPGLTPVVYSEEAQQRGFHQGIANGLFSTGLAALPVVGNSVGAVRTMPLWRSYPRAIASDATLTATALRLAVANQLYVYDATTDLTPKFKGDLLLSNNPAQVLSADLTREKPDPRAAQQALTELILKGLGAMPEATRREMFRKGLLVPTIQRLLRESVKGAPDYFTAAAHPTAFDPAQLDAERFIEKARALTPETLPPQALLLVQQESMPRQWIDYFDGSPTEGIADTPHCITRIRRGMELTRRLTVAANTPGERGISYRWFVVNGDPAKAQIRPLTRDGSLVTIEAEWQAPYEKDGVPMRRVDIACVAVRADGTASAPSFVSLRTLANERRTYDAQGRIAVADYTAPESGFVYEDPAFTAFKNWSDHYQYDAQGRCQGWVRKRPGEPDQRFDARGRRVVATAEDGTPTRVINVSYLPRIVQGGNGLNTPAVELLQSDAGTELDASR